MINGHITTLLKIPHVQIVVNLNFKLCAVLITFGTTTHTPAAAFHMLHEKLFVDLFLAIVVCHEKVVKDREKKLIKKIKLENR